MLLAAPLLCCSISAATAVEFEPVRPSPTAEELAAATPLSNAPYTARPSVEDHEYVSRQLVRRARGQEYHTRFALDCIIAEDGGLACAAADAPPPASDQLEPVLQLMTRFRVAPMTESGEPTAGRRIRLVIRMGVGR
jgi:hypothetical protein